jgi:hypothetical protein
MTGIPFLMRACPFPLFGEIGKIRQHEPNHELFLHRLQLIFACGNFDPGGVNGCKKIISKSVRYRATALPRYLVGLRAPPIFGLLAYSTPCWSK